MKTIVLWLMSTLTVLVLLFGYHTSVRSTSSGSSVRVGGSTTSTVTGSAADTRWGPVQVQLTVANGTITDVSSSSTRTTTARTSRSTPGAADPHPGDARRAERQIDMVSGATVTSDGYLESLQSALDKAGLCDATPCPRPPATSST
jgi:uncharacterized protein with FMN-binding domain